MYMKINELSSYPRVEYRWRRAPETALDLSPRPLQRSSRGLGGRNPVLYCRGSRTRNNRSVEAEVEKAHGGNPSNPKDVKNEGRSGNVYENKGPYDSLPDIKDDICAWLEAVLHKCTRILQKLSALWSQFELWRMNRPLQNPETRGAGLTAT